MEPPSVLDACLGDRRISFDSPLPVEECIARFRAEAMSIIKIDDPEALKVGVAASSVRLQRSYQPCVPIRRWGSLREVEIDLALHESGAATAVSGAAYLSIGTKIDLAVAAALALILTPLLALGAWKGNAPWALRLIFAALALAIVVYPFLIRREAIHEGDRMIAVARRLLA